MKSATGKIANYTYPSALKTNVNDGTLNKSNIKNALGNVISLTDTPGGTITYQYFANGNLKNTDFGGQQTIIVQDGWGRKSKLIEPSAGEYNYTYNGFGQSLTETSPNVTTALVYDNIGKLQTKWVKGTPSPDGTFSGTNILSTYNYYNFPNKKMLENIVVTNPNDGNSIYSYNYDNRKRIVYTKEDFTTIAPRKFENTLTYDLFGRIETEITTATINGFSSTKTIFNEYKNGELFKKRENTATGNPIWTLNNRNARGQITSATLGNNLIAQTNTYHDLGYTLQTKYDKLGTPNANIMTLDNTYDIVQGNMLTRTNNMFAWNETFGYDLRDRLTSYTNKLGAQTTQEYEDNGKIKSNFLGNYRYSSAKPYQNTAIKLSAEGMLEPGMAQTQTIVYNAFKAPISITQGIQRINFGYNMAQDRSVMYYGNSNTDKMLRPIRRFYSADGTMEITQTVATNSYEFTTYIGGDAYTAPIVVRQTDNATSSLFYLHRDHLGSILAISNSLGNVVEKRLFDAWGDIVKVQNGAGVALTKLTFIERGYTGHEHLQYCRLINMNGRLYDPRIHRFLQPDNNLQEPYNTQNYNRYGYVLNNPLRYTDPTGESWWEVIGYVISTYILVANANGGELNPANWNANSILQAVTGIASSLASQGATNAFNKYIDNYGNHPAIPAGGNNPVESHPMVATDGNSGKSLYLLSKNERQTVRNVYENYLNDAPSENEYSIFGHGYEIGIANYNESLKSSKILMIENGEELISLTRLANSKQFTDALVGNIKITINIYACNTGSGDYTNKVGRFVPGIENVAIKLSIRFPNAIINAPNGYVQYGRYKDDSYRILGITRYGDNVPGAMISYQNGIIINTRIFNYNRQTGVTTGN